MNESLKSFGLAIANAQAADALEVTRAAMGRKSAPATAVLETVQASSMIMRPGLRAHKPRHKLEISNAAPEQAAHVLGPDQESTKEAVLAFTAPKYPTAKVTGARRRTRKGTVERVLKLGADEIVINPLDWASVLAVAAGKTPKALVDARWSFGLDAVDGLVRIRDTKTARNGEIAAKSLIRLS